MATINEKMTGLANAIRSKAGVSGALSIDGMTAAVEGIVINPPSGEGADVSGVTATAADVLNTVKFVDNTGILQSGSIATVTPSLAANVFTVSKGYVSENTTLEVPEMEISNDGETVTVPVGYNKTEQTFQVGGGGIDTSDATATASQILNGATAYAKGVKITGNIKSVTATLADNVVTVPTGYIAQTQTLTVAEMSEPSVSANVVTIDKGYNNAQKTVTIPEATITNDGETATVSVGYVKTPQQFNLGSSGSVDLSFITAEAGDIRSGKVGADRNGNPVTGTLVPESGGDEGSSIEFYECASYTPDADAYTKYSFTLSGAPDELANGTYVRTKYIDSIGDDVEYTTASIWKNDNGYSFIEEYEYGDWRYYLKNSSGDYIYGLDSPMPRLTDFNSEYWVDWDMWESVPLAFSAWQTEEIPATIEEWTGYRVTQNIETGLWSKTAEYKEGMKAPFFTPMVGKIYSVDTTIKADLFGSAANDMPDLENLVFFAPLEQNYTDVVSGRDAIITAGEFSNFLGQPCLEFNGDSSDWCRWIVENKPENFPCTIGIAWASKTLESSRWQEYIAGGIAGIASKNQNVKEWGYSYYNTNVWTVCIVTYSANGEGRMYINGVLQKTHSGQTPGDITDKIVVGSDQSGGAEKYIDGFVKGACLWKSELTAEQVRSATEKIMGF